MSYRDHGRSANTADFGRHGARHLPEQFGALRGLHRPRGIRGEAHPRAGNQRAVEVELPDEERMVHELVVARRAPRARAGLRHAGDHAPGFFRLHRDGRGKVERAPFGIQKEVRPVEEQEILARPALRVVERVGLVLKFHGDRPAVVRDDPPGVRPGLVPRERFSSRGRRELRHVAGKPAHLVVARRPDREREDDRLPSPSR